MKSTIHNTYKYAIVFKHDNLYHHSPARVKRSCIVLSREKRVVLFTWRIGRCFCLLYASRSNRLGARAYVRSGYTDLLYNNNNNNYVEQKKKKRKKTNLENIQVQFFIITYCHCCFLEDCMLYC